MGDRRVDSRAKLDGRAKAKQQDDQVETDRVHRRVAGAAALTLSGAVAQAKLAVGPANDPYETEADAVADRVVRSLRSGDASKAKVGADNEPAARRVQRKVTTIGAEGGTVDADTDQAIQSSRGGGKALPDDARSKMEGAFGADFGKIRIHEGAQAAELSNRIQAKAFTVGNDVYFRDGMPDTSSSTGQHLLAHELTHTIQQGGAAARSTDTASGPGARISRKGAWVQRLEECRLPVGAFSYEASATAVLKSKRKKLFPAGSIVRVDDSVSIASDENPNSSWMLVKSVSPPKGKQIGPAPQEAPKKKSWWKGRAAPEQTSDAVVPSKHGWFPSALLGVQADDDGGAVEEATETMTEAISPLGMMGDVADDLGADGDDLLSGNQENQLGMAAGVGGSISGLLGLAASIEKWKEAESGKDQTEALMDTIDSAGGTAAGIAGVVKSAQDAQKGSATADAAGGLGMFTSIFAGIKSTYELVNEAIHLAKKSSQMTKQEQLESTMAIISSLLEAAASGVSAAKTFLDTFGSGASEPLKNSVPGFGIALGTVDMIVRSVALVQALVQKSRMRKDKRAKKQDLEIVMPDGTTVKGQTGKKFAAATLYKTLSKKNEQAPPDAAGQPNPDGCSQPELDFLARCDANPQFQEYLFSKGLQYINQKRANRAILKMAVAMGNISGDVATLGGASAPVGVGLKAGAMALDVGSSLFRKQKQYFRDMRAKKERTAPGVEVTGFLSLYNSEKNSKSKMKEYNKMVDRIFDMIVKASRLEEPASGPDLRFVAVDKYLAAVGISRARVNSFQDDPGALRGEIVKYLQKRE